MKGWPPPQRIMCWGCETMVEYSLGEGHVPSRWKMLKVEGRYRAFCATCLAAKRAEGDKVVYVSKREFRKGR